MHNLNCIAFVFTFSPRVQVLPGRICFDFRHIGSICPVTHLN